jgi:hypothetical protein
MDEPRRAEAWAVSLSPVQARWLRASRRLHLTEVFSWLDYSVPLIRGHIPQRLYRLRPPMP